MVGKVRLGGGGMFCGSARLPHDFGGLSVRQHSVSWPCAAGSGAFQLKESVVILRGICGTCNPMLTSLVAHSCDLCVPNMPSWYWPLVRMETLYL